MGKQKERENACWGLSAPGAWVRERLAGITALPTAGRLLSPPSLFKGKFEYSHASKPRIDWIADFPLDDTPLPSSARLPPPPLIVVMTETALLRSTHVPSSTVRVEQESPGPPAGSWLSAVGVGLSGAHAFLRARTNEPRDTPGQNPATASGKPGHATLPSPRSRCPAALTACLPRPGAPGQKAAGGAPSVPCTPGSFPRGCLGFGREVGGIVWIFLGAQMSLDEFL